MLRFTCLAMLAFLVTACSEGGAEPSFLSEAVAAPVSVPDYGWRTHAPGGGDEGEVKEFH